MVTVNKSYVQCENHGQYKCSTTIIHEFFCFNPVTSSISIWLLCRVICQGIRT